MSVVLKKYDDKFVQVTIEERADGAFITTVWDKDQTCKADREVYEFETYGGAVDKAFDIMAVLKRPEDFDDKNELSVAIKFCNDCLAKARGES